MKVERGQLYGGVALLAIGLIFLFINLGWMRFDAIWMFLWGFWPLVLIVVGLRFLIKNTITFLATVAVLFGVTLSVLVFAPPSLKQQMFSSMQGERADEEPLQHFDELAKNDTELLKFKLDFGAADVRVHSLERVDKVYEARFENAKRITERVNHQNGQLAVDLDQESTMNFFWFSQRERRAEVALSQSVPIEFVLDSGASKVDLDFADIDLRKLTLDVGASSSQIKLGSKAEMLEVALDAGASSLELALPKDIGLEVHADTGLSADNFDDFDLVRDGDVYRSSDFSMQKHKIIIHLDAGASSIKLKRY